MRNSFKSLCAPDSMVNFEPGNTVCTALPTGCSSSPSLTVCDVRPQQLAIAQFSTTCSHDDEPTIATNSEQSTLHNAQRTTHNAQRSKHNTNCHSPDAVAQPRQDSHTDRQPRQDSQTVRQSDSRQTVRQMHVCVCGVFVLLCCGAEQASTSRKRKEQRSNTPTPHPCQHRVTGHTNFVGLLSFVGWFVGSLNGVGTCALCSSE